MIDTIPPSTNEKVTIAALVVPTARKSHPSREAKNVNFQIKPNSITTINRQIRLPPPETHHRRKVSQSHFPTPPPSATAPKLVQKLRVTHFKLNKHKIKSPEASTPRLVESRKSKGVLLLLLPWFQFPFIQFPFNLAPWIWSHPETPTLRKKNSGTLREKENPSEHTKRCTFVLPTCSQSSGERKKRGKTSRTKRHENFFKLNNAIKSLQKKFPPAGRSCVRQSGCQLKKSRVKFVRAF